MNVRERILTIRLLEKAAKHPAYAGNLGIVCAIRHRSRHARFHASQEI